MTSAAQQPRSSLSRRSAEQALVQRARTGSLEAYSELVRLHQGRLYNFLRQQTGDDLDAEDLAQDAFLRAWRQLDRYDPAWRFSTWLFTIAARLAATHRRSARRRQANAPIEETATGEPPPPALLSRFEQQRNIWSLAMRLLSDTERTALWLRYAEDLSAADIGAVLGRSPVAVRVTLHRAKRKIAQRIDDGGMDGTANSASTRSATQLHLAHQAVGAQSDD